VLVRRSLGEGGLFVVNRPLIRYLRHKPALDSELKDGFAEFGDGFGSGEEKVEV